MSQLALLLDTVEKLYDAHVELLQLADRKKDVLIQGDIKELDRIVQEEMGYFKLLSSLEQKRLQELKFIAMQERIPEQDLTLSRLQILTRNEDEKKRMNHLNNEFPKIYQELKEKNDLNARLLYQSLQFVHHTMQLLYPDPQDVTYQPADAGSYGKQQTSLYDFKA
ncbi:flagellar protein FlgN [Fodinisporobacter ferrooxydans]|uniref:Flagellar protein FlgN n=1 Tax=Fodinisporobacter ferrooxydans TaxID=2901836 RepID=A0ABY4CPQ2_9BACL|nr:flagellar protein FlgN [Alicyclobacillaceae bacterium MYW30-H2]